MDYDLLPLSDDTKRILFLDDLRSRGYIVPDDSYPPPRGQYGQSSRQHKPTARDALHAEPTGAEMHPSIYLPTSGRSYSPWSRPQSRESVATTGDSRLASRSTFHRPDPPSPQQARRRGESIERPVFRSNSRSTSNPIPVDDPQLFPLVPKQQKHPASRTMVRWPDQASNSAAILEDNHQSSQQERHVEESLIRSLQDLQLAEPMRDWRRLTPEQRIAEYIKIFKELGTVEFDGKFGASLNKMVGVEVTAIVDDKMNLQHASRLGQESSQISEQMDPELGGCFDNRRRTPVHLTRGLENGSSKLLLSTQPLQPEEMNSTQGMIIRALPRTISADGPILEFSLTLDVRPEETLKREQRWQEFFSFGLVQMVRQLLEVHRVRYNEDIESRAVKGLGQGSQAAQNGQGDGGSDARCWTRGSGGREEDLREVISYECHSYCSPADVRYSNQRDWVEVYGMEDESS